jgi:hypothetical protein
MEVHFDEEVEVEVECPHCKKSFTTMTRAVGMTEVDPPDHNWHD